MSSAQKTSHYLARLLGMSIVAVGVVIAARAIVDLRRYHLDARQQIAIAALGLGCACVGLVPIAVTAGASDMNLLYMAWRYIWNRKLVTALTLFGIALGAALIAGVLTLRRESQNAFNAEGRLYDLVVGAKGSPLQLTLSSVYYMDVPTGNIPMSIYNQLTTNTRVLRAVPIGLGDNYRGFRIVGTTPGYFETKPRPSRDEPNPGPAFTIAEGALFAHSFETVLGSEVARRTGLKIGDTFVGTHGLVSAAGSDEHKEFPYKVVGILAPSQTRSDAAIMTPLDSVWKIHEREKQIHMGAAGGSETGGSAAQPLETTAVLIQLKNPAFRWVMLDDVKKKTEAMAAAPVDEMSRLYQQVLGPMQRALLAIAGLVVVVAGLTILTTLYQAAERRRRDVAVMRALGAHPREIFTLVLFEALFLTLIGLAAGWLLGHGSIALAGPYLRDRMGLSLFAWSIDGAEIKALGAVALVGLIAGIVPAFLIYRRSPVNDLAIV